MGGTIIPYENRIKLKKFNVEKKIPAGHLVQKDDPFNEYSPLWHGIKIFEEVLGQKNQAGHIEQLD